MYILILYIVSAFYLAYLHLSYSLSDEEIGPKEDEMWEDVKWDFHPDDGTGFLILVLIVFLPIVAIYTAIALLAGRRVDRRASDKEIFRAIAEERHDLKHLSIDNPQIVKLITEYKKRLGNQF